MFFFIDNDATRAGYIKLFSQVISIAEVLNEFGKFLGRSPFFAWFSRVASPSNLADNASRLAPLDAYEARAKDESQHTMDTMRAALF